MKNVRPEGSEGHRPTEAAEGRCGVQPQPLVVRLPRLGVSLAIEWTAMREQLLATVAGYVGVEPRRRPAHEALMDMPGRKGRVRLLVGVPGLFGQHCCTKNLGPPARVGMPKIR